MRHHPRACGSILLLLFLSLPTTGCAQFWPTGHPEVRRLQVPGYAVPPGHILLQMPYASDSVLNPEAWVPGLGTPTGISLIYTAYPADTAQWLTPFSALGSARLAQAYARDPRLRQVPLTLVAQTAPKTAQAARRMLHGVAIAYQPDTPMGQEPVPMPDYAHDSYQPPDPNDRYFQAAAMAEVRRIADGATPKSAAVLQALQRNPQWRDMLVVVDWTGSMYEYGAQLLQWQQQHRGQIRHWVFFNDGDDALKDVASRMRDKPLGRTGGLYAVRQPQGTEAVLQAMAYVMKRGSGGDVAENNLEALLRAAATFPDRGDVVMIADNSSAMRDSSLRGQVRFPVHIIACDALPGPVRPEYVDLAWRSGGSVSGTGFTHSFGRPQAPIPADGVQLGRARYVLQQGELVLYTP
ncbi:MAG: hypothetical protein LW884_03495 [Bacteroidetes bacterium]|nr:hypothetical protein [Bacteroidota bacterium]